MAKSHEGRLEYIDLLKVFSMFAVIAVHVSGGWLEATTPGTSAWTGLHGWDALTHWAVPVFVMCSGAFALDPKKKLSMWDLFFRYLLRMTTAFLFWGVIYHLLPSMMYGYFSFSLIPGAISAVFHGSMSIHLWYLPMMFGLYLITPFLRAFVRGAKRSDFHWFFLFVFVFIFFLPLYLKLTGNELVALYASRLYLNFHMTYPIFGYVGYYVAGYYLKEYTISRLAEGLIYVAGIIGAVVTVLGGVTLNPSYSKSLNLTMMGYLTPNVAAMAVALFVLFRYVLGISNERSRRQRVGRTAQYSFGVYLNHIVFLQLLRLWGLATPSIPTVIAVPILVFVIFIPSFALSWLMNKIPFLNYYIT